MTTAESVIDAFPAPYKPVNPVYEDVRSLPVDFRLAHHRIAEAQLEFVGPEFAEATQMPVATRKLDGPRRNEIADILDTVHKAAVHNGEQLDVGYFSPTPYLEPGYEVDTLHPDAQIKRALAIRNKYALLTEAGSRWSESSSDAPLSPGLLGLPPYLRQEDKKNCFAACFRMMYAGATEIELEEKTVVDAVRASGSRLPADDDLFLNVFSAPSFKATHDADVRTITITGAELSTVATLTERLKSGKENRRVYGTVSLGSEVGAGDPDYDSIWHSNALLAADAETVVVHDPSNWGWGAAYRRLEKETFYKRWAIALNRVHLFVVDPK